MLGAGGEGVCGVVFGFGESVVTFRTPEKPTGTSKIMNKWVVDKIMALFWVPNIVRHPLFRVPKKGP